MVQLSGGWAQQELSLDGPPLQSLSVDRGRAGAILIDIEYDDGDDDDNDDDDDDNDDDDEDDDDDDNDDLLFFLPQLMMPLLYCF